MPSTVLVIDDDRSVVLIVSRALEKLGVTITSAATADAGLRQIEADHPDVVLLDILLPRMSGLEVFARVRTIDRRLPVIFITADAGSETVIEAMQLGAYDYVAKPLNTEHLAEVVSSALETRRLMNVPISVAVRDEQKASDSGDLFIGRSPQMLEVFKEIGRASKQSVTVLIRGESGTGKELVARALYQFSDRANRPFMAVNCAALPDTLLESELFGHERGAFTSADRRRIGKFEQCNGGTLFLDEVGDMSPLVQGKVLRALQEQRFERVGGNETIETDVRLIAATNRPLEDMVIDGRFRGDLFYRLNVVTIDLPPLRDRTGDIPLLLEYFLTRVRAELGKTEIEGITPEAVALLEKYDWPGNIRELQSIVRQTMLKTTGPVIVPDFLPAMIRGEPLESFPGIELKGESHHAHTTFSLSPTHATPTGQELPLCDVRQFIEDRLECGTADLYAEVVEHVERYLLTRVLQVANGNQSKAAAILGITRGKVRDRIAAFKITLGNNVTIDAGE
ncbi:MAG: sigma-54 dependent transcriptional regulator [Planctomycetaceae bacterium]|nr:sigma-54 dependent transcriptional regulator [Planctomycetaceae bacterium]